MMAFTLAVSVLMWLQAATPGSAQRKGAVMVGEELIDVWLSVADRVGTEGYVPIQDFSTLPANVRGDTSQWLERFLTHAANPHNLNSGIQVRTHLSTSDSPDLLRYDYDLAPWRLSVIESNNFMLVLVGGQPAPFKSTQSNLREYVESAATSILNMKDADHQWVFQFPSQIEDGAIFSTDPTKDPLHLPQWTDRADGGFHNGTLYFLCYKKVLAVAGYEDIKQWFTPAFRQRFH